VGNIGNGIISSSPNTTGMMTKPQEQMGG